MTMQAKGPTRGRKSEASRAQILDAAARLLRDQGYGAMTLRQIAERADIKAGSVYYHFASKDEILDAVLARGLHVVIEAVEGRLAALPAGAGHLERIAAAVAAHLEALLAHGDYTSAGIRTFGQVPEASRQKDERLREEYIALWQHLLQQAQAAGEIRADLDTSVLRALLLGSLNWTVEWYDPARQPVETVATQTVDILFRGIAAPPMDARAKPGAR
ncbi:MAG: TetR/AcrR family transcriptional regulator [Alphaproteobacteria bacterium]|jgi:AcrR family transcriptional regulator|nr:TetR/AcrR family transcriptional regulator [Alphaproteobacteria bacterium]MDP6566280.1 TetR/AcrR family transcriptional regulator [Alphaproteobacteria bacterium]MDP6813699.1 TetR/AcrR family transcriptional regulator [Alphaproteobacteria bacterium]